MGEQADRHDIDQHTPGLQTNQRIAQEGVFLAAFGCANVACFKIVGRVEVKQPPSVLRQVGVAVIGVQYLVEHVCGQWSAGFGQFDAVALHGVLTAPQVLGDIGQRLALTSAGVEQTQGAATARGGSQGLSDEA